MLPASQTRSQSLRADGAGPPPLAPHQSRRHRPAHAVAVHDEQRRSAPPLRSPKPRSRQVAGLSYHRKNPPLHLRFLLSLQLLLCRASKPMDLQLWFQALGKRVLAKMQISVFPFQTQLPSCPRRWSSLHCRLARHHPAASSVQLRRSTPTSLNPSRRNQRRWRSGFGRNTRN